MVKQHKKSHHGGVTYHCVECDFIATQESVVKQHKKSKHEGIKYPCDECDFRGT